MFKSRHDGVKKEKQIQKRVASATMKTLPNLKSDKFKLNLRQNLQETDNDYGFDKLQMNGTMTDITNTREGLEVDFRTIQHYNEDTDRPQNNLP